MNKDILLDKGVSNIQSHIKQVKAVNEIVEKGKGVKVEKFSYIPDGALFQREPVKNVDTLTGLVEKKEFVPKTRQHSPFNQPKGRQTLTAATNLVPLANLGQGWDPSSDYNSKSSHIRTQLLKNIRRNTPNRQSDQKETLSVEGFNNVYGSAHYRMQNRAQLGSAGLHQHNHQRTKISAHALKSFGSGTTSNATTNAGQIS